MSSAYEKIRNHAGLVDLKNWVRIEITGADAATALDSVVGGNILDLFEGKAMNTLIPSLSGGVEAIVWILAIEAGFQIIAEPDEYAPVTAVLDELTQNFDICVSNLQNNTFHLLVTGPEAEKIAIAALGDEVQSIAFLNAFELADGVMAARIGFFGEYELHLFGDASLQDSIIANLLSHGSSDIVTDDSAFPVMMAEMRILNRARDVPEDASVFDVGLQWMIDFQKDNLRAADALANRRGEKANSCVLMVLDSKDVSAKTDISVEGEVIGHVRSAYYSETLNNSVALVFLNRDLAVPGLVFETSEGIAQTVSAPAFLSKSVLNALGQAA